MQFEFATAGRIFFGIGALRNLGDIVPDMGMRCFVLSGGGSVSPEPLHEILNKAGVRIDSFRISGEPNVPTIQAGLEKARETRCDFVVGYGGGSVIDSAKAVAALMTNSGGLLDYLEVIGQGKKIEKPPLPMVAIPTTAGTGSEVTRNAVIASPEHKVKVSMRSPMMIPGVAIVDPELTVTMPPEVTASTGMDALTQVIEAFVSNRANPMTDVIAREGIKRGARSLMAACENGRDLAAREDMSLCSLFGGLALANGGLGAVHGFAGPIGGMFNASHGEICASLLPYVVKHNVQTIARQKGSVGFKHRYLEVAKILTGDRAAGVEDGVTWLETLIDRLDIPGLGILGIQKSDFYRIISKAKVSSSMQKNPVQLDDSTLYAILEEAY